MKTRNIITITSLILAFFFSSFRAKAQPSGYAADDFQVDPKIQMAILLDASNSMDGLIGQAKARLWSIVNTLTTLRYDGKQPIIEIALYMYGNDGLSDKDNYIRQITPFTTDLDLISEKLFAITTYGGSEYCGAVIDHALKNLRWNMNKQSMKLVYIAGNEPFSQGKIHYVEALKDAVSKDVFVNTIYCGNCEQGVQELWKDGADKGKGQYFCINSDMEIMYVATPWDDEINRQNILLNETYIYYGSYGQYGYANQSAQDMNAQSVAGANYTERAVSKSKAIYNNYAWDLVDMHKQDPSFYKTVDHKTLPEAYQTMTESELLKEIEKMATERVRIQNEISLLSVKRLEYIKNNSKESEDDFGLAVNQSIVQFAKIKGFTVE